MPALRGATTFSFASPVEFAQSPQNAAHPGDTWGLQIFPQPLPSSPFLMWSLLASSLFSFPGANACLPRAPHSFLCVILSITESSPQPPGRCCSSSFADEERDLAKPHRSEGNPRIQTPNPGSLTGRSVSCHLSAGLQPHASRRGFLPTASFFKATEGLDL